MAVNHNFLHGVLVGSTSTKTGYINNSKYQLAGTVCHRLATVGVGELPKHVGPLGIAGQKYNCRLGVGPGSRAHLSFNAAQIHTLWHIASWLACCGLGV